VIYFVQNGDTLWDIAKRYSVKCDEIMEFNKLDEESRINTGMRLFIP
jgi:LysM repeat protein